MNGRQFSFGTSGNPIGQILSLFVLGAVLVIAVIMGAFVLLAFLSIAVVGFIAFTVRAWWLRRTQRRGPGGDGSGTPGPAKGARLIEGEYVVVDADADAARRKLGGR